MGLNALRDSQVSTTHFCSICFFLSHSVSFTFSLPAGVGDFTALFFQVFFFCCPTDHPLASTLCVYTPCVFQYSHELLRMTYDLSEEALP